MYRSVESSSEKNYRKKYKTGAENFTDSVFSWSLEDIFNDVFFKSKVQKIPESFESVEHYLGSYVNPLLEEIRAELKLSLEVLNRAPFAEIISSREVKPHGTKSYQIRVDYWRNKSNNGGQKEPYKPLPGDVFVLAHGKPQSIVDLQRAGNSWAFLSLTGIRGYGDNAQFTVKASREFEHKTQTCLIFLANLIPQKRIWEALHMRSNVGLINKVLRVESIDSVDKKKSVGCSKKAMSVGVDNSATIVSSNLNESQTGAVLSCLNMLQSGNGSSFKLIWGPPGTGKTKTISTLLVSLLRRNCKTLVCAPTNVAITELASRVLKMVLDARGDSLLCSLGDILLFGTKERLNIGSDIEDIFLDYRVEKLAECFGRLGWKHCFTTMINLLEKCVPEYRLAVENELAEERGQCKEDRVEDGKKTLSSFLNYFRERFDAALSEFKSSLSVTCTHTAESYILTNNLKNMVSVIGLLDSFRALLFQADVVSESLEEIFSRTEVIEEVSHPTTTDNKSLLFIKRSECISSLKAHRYSLDKLEVSGFKSELAIKKFCFEKASLIFCTVSTSAKLQKLGVTPTILVIDEAAQLKESESTIPLQLAGLKHVILVGDEWQLPATVKSKVSMEAGFGRSLFERLSSQNHPKHLLNIQYRMHPSISVFPNSKFYHNQIQDDLIVTQKSYRKRYLPGPLFGPYSFINIVGGMEEKEVDGHSWKNMVEVAVILKILQNLYKAWIRSRCKLSVGIVSPYAAQVAAIQYKLGKTYNDIHGFQVKAKTVDGFQGGEEDIIMMSTVRSKRGCSLDFISNPQRINVALTRARHCLWILGNERTLANSQTVWESIVIDAKNRGCFFRADCNKDLAKAIIEIKKQLGQFDDLLDTNSNIFKSSKWKVIFSDNFVKSFKKLESIRTRKLVIDLLVKLSNGWRPRSHMGAVSISSLEIQTFKVSSLCIVSTVDIDRTDSRYTQVLRMWDLLPPEDIPELVTHLERMFEKYSEEFKELCNEKCLESKLEIPKSWPPDLDVVRFKDISFTEAGRGLESPASDGKACVGNSRFDESPLGMRFYSLSKCVVNHMLSDRDARELDLPFGLTDQEKEIILSHRSAFVLGRPGTGKTTVLTMKLFKKEYIHSMVADGFNRIKSNGIDPNRVDEEKSVETKPNVLRQLFVTESPKLRNSVKKHLSLLKRSSHLADITSTDVDDNECEETEFKSVPLSLLDVPLDSYPLVITFREFLMMLDGTLSKSYFERFINMSELSQIQNASSRSDAFQFFIRKKEVNHERFSSKYWPRLNPQLKKNLEPSSVFTEIVSHIKGGLQAMEASEGKLTRAKYVASAEICGPKLSRTKRELIYDIFEVYEQMKVENGELDLADFANDLHRRLKHERYQGDEMNFVYVDEVEHLTPSQFSLFRHVCSNVEEGFVFSGDSVQAISRGDNSRIRDIRSLFHKKFVLQSKGKGEQTQEKDQFSDMFHLTQKFRTCSGILNLSQSIVELLYHFFPRSIDIIEPETTSLDGGAPLFLHSADNEDVLLKLFGDCRNIIRSTCFGAEQVIVVRDTSEQKKIKDRIQKKALILTVSECKGLEFQDVLLYNFFGSSPLRKQWRIIYEYMKEQGSFVLTSPSFPILDKCKRGILLDELKQLHVAISSSKKRLWICDDLKLSEPMIEFWKKKCLVQVQEVDGFLEREMQVSSTPKEWKSRGIKLYYNHNHEMATMCFEKAREAFWEKKSKAAGLEAMAHHVNSSNPEEGNSLMRKAAEIFQAIGMTESAARCSSYSKDYGRTGRVCLASFGQPEFQRARECFSVAACYKLAADVYAKRSLFSECLAICAKGKLFDMGFQYLQRWKQHAKQKHHTISQGKEFNQIEQEFLESYALHYHEVKDTKSMMKVVGSFASMNSVRSFSRSLGCLDELLALEVKSENFAEAAEVAKLKGDVLVVVNLLEKAKKFREAATLLLSYVLSNSLWSSGKKGWPLQLFKQKDNLLTKAKSFAKNETQSFYECVCAEADVMENKTNDLVMRKDQLKASQRHKSIRGEILSARKILDAHLASALNNYLCKEDLMLDPMKHSEDTVSQNQVSVDSLVRFWNLWMQKIVGVFEYLGSLGSKDGDKFEDYGEFCLSFLGIWRQFHDMNTIYILLISDADWARNVEKSSALNGGKLLSLDACQFVSAAQSYWSSEVLSVGFMVLGKLEVLYKTMTQKSDLLLGKCKTLALIYEVARLLWHSKFLKRTDEDSESLQKFMRLSTDDFIGYAFPLDSRVALRDGLPFIRETDFCKNFLKQVVVEYIDSSNELSPGRIGSIAMVILGSGELTGELVENVLERMNHNQPWKIFFETLSRSRVPNQLLICRFQEALVDAYETRKAEYEHICPGCFLYLVERLLIWVCSSQGYFIATKYSFVEWLIYQEIDSNNMSSSKVVLDLQASLATLQSIISVIRCCFFNKKDTVEWIKRSTERVDECYQILVCRMVVIICLIYANFGMCSDMLSAFLGSDYITKQLPKEFCDALKCLLLNFNLNVLAGAFKNMDNSLVIVKFGENFSRLSFPDAMIVDMKVNRRKNDILRTLFGKRDEALKMLCSAPPAEASDSAGTSSDKPSHLDSHTLKKHKGSSLIDDVSFWGIFEGINCEESGGGDGKFYSNAQTMKVDVDRYVCLLTAAITGSLRSTGDFERKNSSGEMFYMIDELKQLSAALDTENTSLAKEISKTLQSRRPRMERFLNQLFNQHKTDHSYERLNTFVASTARCFKSTSAGSISKPNEGNSRGSQANIALENKAEVAATKRKETERGCYIL